MVGLPRKIRRKIVQLRANHIFSNRENMASSVFCTPISPVFSALNWHNTSLFWFLSPRRHRGRVFVEQNHRKTLETWIHWTRKNWYWRVQNGGRDGRCESQKIDRHARSSMVRSYGVSVCVCERLIVIGSSRRQHTTVIRSRRMTWKKRKIIFSNR